MTTIKRIAVVLGCNGLLSILLVALNRSLAHYSCHLFVPALFLIYPTLFLPLRPGLIAVGLAAAFIEANLPVPIGSFVFLALGFALLVNRYRHRLRSEQLQYSISLALVMNLFFFSGVSILAPVNLPFRLLTDFLLSSITVALLSGWFLSLQHASLILLRSKPRPDEF
ncbi:MAG: hypothetical protein ACFCU4_01690 [Puniceicoccaceae bacterium]